jgi:thioredoxin-like negative regulator of GroEL
MPKVQKIEPSRYSDAVKNMRKYTGIILVFHPSCGHCIQLKPSWEQMKKEASTKVNFMEINGEGMSDHESMRNSIAGKNTEGFPTIMGLKNGRILSKFNEERTVPNMVKFANKFTSSSSGSFKNSGKNKKRSTKKHRKTKK